MIKYTSLFFVLLLTGLMPLYGQDLNTILNQLDETIDNRPKYIAEKEKKLESLRIETIRKTGEEQFNGYKQLFIEYRTFSADSALHYAQVCNTWAIEHKDPIKQQESQIMGAIAMAVIGQYEQANILISELESHVYPENKEEYYSARTDISYWQGAFSSLKRVKDRYDKLSQVYRDSLNQITKNKTFKEQASVIIQGWTDPKGSISATRRYLQDLPEGHDSIRYFANHLGTIYQNEGKRDSSEYFFAISAISDMEHGVREHSSLINLTMQLFEDGEVNRAYKYMTQCLNDANESSSALRNLEMSKMMSPIMDAYNKKLKHQEQILTWISIALAILLIIIILELFRIYGISKKLKAAQEIVLKSNEDLRISNEKLALSLEKEKNMRNNLLESNRIKDTYLANYMSDCSGFIDKLDAYRKSLQQLVMRNNIDKLISSIRSTDFIENEIELFYKGFDDTFLSVFPNFVEEFNKLLTPEGQIVPPAKKRLTTELRIFALIRLGITDSNDIAKFLRYSVKTIYNYRTKVRNSALGNRNELEEKLKEIGIEKEEKES